MFHKWLLILLVCMGGIMLAGCGGSSPPAAVVDVAASVTAVEQKVVSQNNSVVPANPVMQTPVPTQPAAKIVSVAMVEPAEPTTSEPATAVPQPPTCATLQGLNLRYGPGTSYAPPLRTLAASETLLPLAFSAVGHPSGQWVQVRVIDTSEIGWVSAGSQYIGCNINLASLPAAANIPAPPTPVVVANNAGQGPVARPMNVTPGVIGGEVDEDPLMDFHYQFNNGFLLRLDIKNYHDQVDADVNGRGVQKVTFEISNRETGQPVYAHEEGTAGYCIFRGGEPDCRPWPQDGNGRYTWGEGGPLVEPGAYKVNVFIYAKDQNAETQSWSWGSEFDIWP